MFSWRGRDPADGTGEARAARGASPSSLSKYASEDEVYNNALPPTLPVVKDTIDRLASLAAKQRMFISSHADKIKLELIKERVHPSVPIGEWRLNWVRLSGEDAVDFVRQSPDSLSNMTFVVYRQTSLWTTITSWLRFGNMDRSAPNALKLADDMGFVLAVAECVELTGNVLGVVSHALSTQAPRVGNPLRRQLAFELTRSNHRGNSHSMYLLATIVHATQNAAAGRTASTLKVDLALYIYETRFLGGLSGVAVNVSGLDADDLPTADLEAAELRQVLAKNGTFVASAVSDFVLDPTKETTSERATRISVLASEKLINAANDALRLFFETESSKLEADRASMRERHVEQERARIEREATLAKEEAVAREADERAREERVRNPPGPVAQYGMYARGPIGGKYD